MRAQKGIVLARHALVATPSEVPALEYRTELPDEKLIAEELKTQSGRAFAKKRLK